jgi:cytochrome P450
MQDIGVKFNHVYTFYLGKNPSVIITDPAIGLQVLKKHTFAGRPKIDFMDHFFREDSIDIVFADFGKEWEALRKVGHSAARKYAVSPSLAPVVTNVVDRMIDRVKEEPFNSEDSFALIMMAILAQAAFGKKYEFEDEEFLRWKETIDSNSRVNRLLMMIFFVPVLRHLPFFRATWKEFMNTINYQRDYIELMYKRALENYTDGKNETFCDAMITAKKEAELEENWMLPYLKPQNMYNAVSDLFAAGTDTTRMTLGWVFILMAKYPDMQEKMRHEIEHATEGEVITLNHRSNCDFVLAFINECMRFRPIVPAGVAHKTTIDETIDGHPIPEGTTVVVSLYASLTDPKIWDEPQEFRPERFLDEDGKKFVSKPNAYFIPFSDGRRSCPGNKLALNNLFLVVGRFLQRTKMIDIDGSVNDDHMKGDLMKSNGYMSVQYKIKLTLKKD